MNFAINLPRNIIPLILVIIPFSCIAQSSVDEHLPNSGKKFEQARFVFHSAYFEKATLLFDEYLEENPDYPLAYAYKAMLDMLLYRDPLSNIEKAKFLAQKTNPNYYFTMALCNFAKGELTASESLMKTHLTKFPDDHYGWHVLGFTKTDLGKPEEGKKILERLLVSNPAYYPAYNHLGYAYLGLKSYEQAIAAFENFLEGNDLNPSALDSYAEGLFHLEEYDKAISMLSKAVLLEPKFAYAWMHMGDILVHTGDKETAIKAYEKAKESAELYGQDFTDHVNDKIAKARG